MLSSLLLAHLMLKTSIKALFLLVLLGNITYLQVVDSMTIIVLYPPSLRKGEEPKAPRHASAAATRDGNLPRITVICLYSRHWQLFFYGYHLYIYTARLA